MQYVRPKKSLGQHFLTDKNIAKKITESLSGSNYQSVVEVGPGTGVLTQFLIENSLPFHAVEIDRESIAYLKNAYPGNNFLIEGDFLKIDLNRFPSPMAIIGNFPYNISSQIFFKVLEYPSKVDEIVCMIQKEVAERIAAPPGNKTYGILSVFLQTYYTIEYLFTVHENCFNPAPKVKSAVIRLKRNNCEELPCDKALFFRVVKQAFNQRRKTLRNSLRNICLTLDTGSEIFNKRPEQLGVEEFLKLSAMIESQEKQID
jgi:16S rRNA (adenine1518-N6/adenine1519-N6)-dimethyltransferase